MFTLEQGPFLKGRAVRQKKLSEKRSLIEVYRLLESLSTGITGGELGMSVCITSRQQGSEACYVYGMVASKIKLETVTADQQIGWPSDMVSDSPP